MAGNQEVFKWGPATATIANANSNALGCPGGTLRVDTDGKEYRLVQAGATVAGSAAVRLDSVSASAGTIVEQLSNNADFHALYGVNPSSDSIAANGYFWAQVFGSCVIRSEDMGVAEDFTPIGAQCAINSLGQIQTVIAASNATAGQFPCGAVVLITMASDASSAGTVQINAFGR